MTLTVVKLRYIPEIGCCSGSLKEIKHTRVSFDYENWKFAKILEELQMRTKYL
jgi:hypothetical protein